MIIDQHFAGRLIQLSVGQVAELRLPENPTTGFHWSIVANGKPACDLSAGAFHLYPGPPGRGGEDVWEIRALQPGPCDIELVSRRSFGPATPSDFTFSLRIHVIDGVH